MDSPIVILRYALLAVLLAPLGAAALVAVLRGKAPQRFASFFALTHLGLTILVGLMAYSELSERTTKPTDTASEVKEFRAFKPIFVPGDPGFAGDANSQTYSTTWSILTLGKTAPTVPPADVQFYVGLDGLNVWLVLLTSLMTYVAIQVSWGSVTERTNGFYGWVFVLQSGLIGAFISFDVILFYVFFELTLIPVFFLIGSWGVGGGKRDAARKFFLYTLLGSLLTLTGVIGIVVTNPTPMLTTERATYGYMPSPDGTQVAPKPGTITFSIPELMKNVNTWSNVKPGDAYIAQTKFDKAAATATAAQAKADAAPNDAVLRRVADDAAVASVRAESDKVAAEAERDRYQTLQVWFFVALIAGFAVKIPIVPFHTWLPAAYGEAPMGVTLLLSALMAKLGTYGLLRIVLPLAPEPSLAYGLPVFGGLGAFGIVYAAFCAYAQRDLKLLTAYSSVSHLGFLVVGLFAFNAEGLTGASLHMINHGLSTGAMFALLGFLASRYQTLDVNQYSGLWARFPGFAFFLMVMSLASVGLPGLNNFVSEMMMLSSVFTPDSVAKGGYWIAAAAVAGIFLSAWYTMTMLRRVLFGPPQEPTTAAPPKGLTQREIASFAVPAVLCLVLGLYPQPVTDVMKPDVALIVKAGDNARKRADASSLVTPVGNR